MDIEKISVEEKKILAAALKCGEKRLSVSGLAEESGVKKTVICEKLKNPEFRQLFSEVMQAALTAETPEILHTFVSAAKEGSFKHGKLILELTGVYSEKQKIELGGKVELTETLFKSDEDRESFAKATLDKLLRKEEDLDE